MYLKLLLLVIYIQHIEGQNVVFDPSPENSTVLEGGTARFTCVPKVNGVLGLALWSLQPTGGSVAFPRTDNATILTGASGVYLSPDRTQLIITGVQDSLHLTSVLCRGTNADATLTPVSADIVYILVQKPPNFTLSEDTRMIEKIEGQGLTVTLENYDSGYPEGSLWVEFQDKVFTEGNGFTLTGSGDTLRIVFPAVYRNNTGVYRVILNNTHGSAMSNFTLNVIYPPEHSGIASVREAQLSRGSTFTFDCTPSAANPSDVEYSFKRNGTTISSSGPVLTISSVNRGDSGNYSCTANNTAGSTVLYYALLVVAPPTEPRMVRVSTNPFSAIISWTPPTDDGGVSSPSWTTPSPDSPTGLSYKVTHSNSSGSWVSTVNSTQLVLDGLQHSTDYTVSVAAENAHGSGPSVEVMFRTTDTKPIIDRVAITPLSLYNFTVNVTLLTVGGQPITSFTVTVNGTEEVVNTQVPDSKLVTVSIVVGNMTLTKGTDYDVSITATNSIGTSEPITGTLSVPNPPNITAPPSELSPSNITTCCAGVRLNLADPDDVSDVSVLLNTSSDGSYEMVSAGNLTRSGDILYIMGLQAGTVYTASITVSNIFGLTTQQTTLKPLLGRPSNPAIPTVTSDGTTVTVVLSTDYPGTERMRSGSMFSFQLQFTKDGRSAGQSDTQVVSATPSGLSSPVTTTYQGVLSGGSYTVRVTAVNEHGSSESVVSEEFVVTEPTQPADSTPVIVGVVIGVVVAILLVVIIIIFVIMILYMKFWKNTRGNSPPTNPGKEDCVYDEVETHSETEIKNVQLESNPAYQPITIEGSAQNPNYEEVEMKLTANPAYEPIGQAHISKTKPVYANL